MSSIFGHSLAAIYQDRAYAVRPRASWLAIGAAFAIGVVFAVAAMKMPGSSDRPTQAAAPQSAPKPGSPASVQVAAGKTDTGAKSIRVIAPDVVPPPPNVTAAVSSQAATKAAVADTPATNTPVAAAADTNVGAAPREAVAELAPAGHVPMPAPKPAELRTASAPEAAPASVGDASVPSGAAAAAPPAAVAAPWSQPEVREPAAKPTRKEARAARREAKRIEREERRRLAQERSRALHERNAADGFSLVDAYRTRDGRRVTVYRRYDEDRRGAMAFGEDRSRRGFFGLFDFD